MLSLTRDLGDHAPRFEQLTRRANWRVDRILALNADELIHSEEMRDGLVSNLGRVLACARNGHSDGQMALEVPEQ